MYLKNDQGERFSIYFTRGYSANYLSYEDIDINNVRIISDNKNEIVFIEVKTRTNINYGNPAEAVNTPKQKHIKRATEYYVHINKLYKYYIRFDVIEIYYKNKRTQINPINQAIAY